MPLKYTFIVNGCFDAPEEDWAIYEIDQDSYNNTFSSTVEERSCGCNNNGFLGGCDSEILFFIIIFLLLFTNYGCGCRG